VRTVILSAFTCLKLLGFPTPLHKFSYLWSASHKGENKFAQEVTSQQRSQTVWTMDQCQVFISEHHISSP